MLSLEVFADDCLQTPCDNQNSPGLWPKACGNQSYSFAFSTPIAMAIRILLGAFGLEVCQPGGFFGKKSVPEIKMCISKTIGVFLRIFAILTNIDLNLKFRICKIAI